jgi:two-component system sensor histidine kinase PhoQ
MLLRRLLRPLRQIETEIGEIEEGKRAELSEQFPSELAGVARNMNMLIETERARSDRYRLTLDNLAHSLKTPLAALRSLLSDRGNGGYVERSNEQIDRMDEIVRYQLRKPAASSTTTLARAPVQVSHEIRRLVAGLQKVYRDKNPNITVAIDSSAQFRGDAGDFLELAGNLLDNSCKWCDADVAITIRAPSHTAAGDGGMVLIVSDDGPGIPADAAQALLERGTRLDESTPGHGIGLAIVRDIASAYSAELSIARSAALGGAEITVTFPATVRSRKR